ncbi:MAG: DNA polymerase III subunit alpha, partial [Alicyclobacillus sp.]|nr:DNA polymerase III subunit alpha [Alicyclobacillus sp.]
KRTVLDAERTRFVNGCLAQGYTAEVANEVYDLIVRFADYGYPRSHAAAYAVLTYRTAYLRANWFAEFAAVSLTNAMGNPDKVALYTRDAKRHGISVYPPSVVHSSWAYTVEPDGNIRTGLLAVRGVGRSAADAILQAREAAPFTSLVDFLERVNNRLCNRRAVESLLAAGALDAFLPDGTSREVGLQIVDEAYRSASKQGSWVSAVGPGLGLDLSAGSGTPKNAVGRAHGRGPGRADSASPDAMALYIRIRHEPTADWLDQMHAVLRMQPGDMPVALYHEAQKRARLLDPQWRVAPTPELIALLEEIAGLGNVRVGRLPRTR